MLLHNKYYQILKQYLGDYERGIYGRELVGKIPLSQKAIALALQDLAKQSILKYTKRGQIKEYKLNLAIPKTKDMIIATELLQKTEFLEKHQVLTYLFEKEDDRIIGIFGSYAKGREKKDSDIDIFILGEKKKEDYDSKGATYRLDVSIKYFSQEEFERLLREENPLCREMVRYHVLMFGAERFVHLLKRRVRLL